MSDRDLIEQRLGLIKEGLDSLSGMIDSDGASDDDANNGIEGLPEKLDALKTEFRELSRLVRPLASECITYKDEYTRYRIAYERLVNSGSVKLALKARSLLGRDYLPLKPVDLEMSDALLPLFWGKEHTIDHPEADATEVERFKRSWRDFIELVPDGNGGNYFKKHDMRVGIITDEYMFNFYKDAVDLVYIDPKDYERQIAEGDLSLVLYVSCWTGMNEDYFEEEGRKVARDVLRFANSLGIPTVFQTIEDPPHFEDFLPIAQEATCVFTSDSSMVEAYKDRLLTDNVFVLEYGVNPAFHNPVGFMNPKDEDGSFGKDVLFSGSWYENFPYRCLDTERVFDGVLATKDSCLIIADRFSGKPESEKAYKVFPKLYDPYIVDAIDHADLQKVHKLFDYSICVNTVKDSPTMCAMRVYELQALGSLMLSNYALSVSRNFPSIFMINNEDEVAHILGGYEPREVFAMQVEGIRRMFSGATVYDRLNEVFKHAGIPERFEHRRVAVVLPCELYERRNEFSELSMPGVEAIEAGADGGADLARYDYAVWATEEALSYRHFVEDGVNAFKFADVDYVRYVDDAGYRDSYTYESGTARQQDTLFALDRVEASRIDDPSYLATLDGFSVARALWGRDTSDTPKELAVVMPVHNNGRHLRERSFLSLLRSSVFSSMRIYLMDDGSSDPYTRKVIAELCEDFDNVVSARCGESGSGSASLPRNMGVRESSEPYITFLDPDNEAIGDGYARLLEAVKTDDVDFVMGDTISVSAPDYEPVWSNSFDEERVYVDPRAILIEQDFEPCNPQACVFKRKFLEESKIEFVEGAVGEDSLYYYEMMLNASSFAYEHVPASVYYMESEGSTVNAISPGFFEKSLLAERAQVEVLERHGILDEYKKRHLEFFMDNWYARKLGMVRAEDRPRCERIVEEIKGLYA